MNSKFEIDSSDKTSHQNADDSAPRSESKEDRIMPKTQKIIQKLNHFMVDKRYALMLDEVI